VLAVVLIGQFMAVLDASIVNVAAPSIHASLDASGAGLQLVVAGYTITYAVTRVLLRVPVELAADATGVVVTVNQLGLLVGVAAFGTLYLNLAGRLPAHAALGAFRPVSAHAEAVTSLALAALAGVGVILAVIGVLERRTAKP
jgi:MFS family permease